MIVYLENSTESTQKKLQELISGFSKAQNQYTKVNYKAGLQECWSEDLCESTPS